MLIVASHLIGTPILSLQATAAVARITDFVIDPSSLKIIAFRVSGAGAASILATKNVREYSDYGLVIDSIDDFAEPGDIVKVDDIIKLNFAIPGLKVETKKGSKLGKVTDFTVTSDNFSLQQIIVKRPVYKSFIDPELTIPRHEIIEVTDYKIIVKDEEKVIKERAMNEDFIPNFVNPFRKTAPTPVKTKDD